MNERIQELAQQAGIHPVNFEPDADLAVPLTAFAELIVQECIDISTDVEDEALQNREFKAGSAATLIKVLIKKHFGVEL